MAKKNDCEIKAVINLFANEICTCERNGTVHGKTLQHQKHIVARVFLFHILMSHLKLFLWSTLDFTKDQRLLVLCNSLRFHRSEKKSRPGACKSWIQNYSWKFLLETIFSLPLCAMKKYMFAIIANSTSIWLWCWIKSKQVPKLQNYKAQRVNGKSFLFYSFIYCCFEFYFAFHEIQKINSKIFHQK